jgi:adenylate cyclase
MKQPSILLDIRSGYAAIWLDFGVLLSILNSPNCILSEDYEAGLEWANRTLQIPTASGYWAPAVKAAALGNLGRIDEAKQALALALEAKPDLSINFLENNMPTKHAGGLDPYLNGLRKSGLQ